MKSTRFYKIIIAILVVMNLVTLAFLWFGGSLLIPGPVRGKASEFLISELKLTHDQVEEFGKLRSIHHEKMQTLQDRDRMMHDRFFGALFLTPPDTITAGILADSIAELRKQMDMLTFEHFRQLRLTLTELQKVKFQKVFNQALDRALPPLPPMPPPPPPPNAGAPPPPPPPPGNKK
jgi:periplasmic protein CpxP/Spy